MIKQFKVFFIVGMLASSLFATNCGDKGSDNSALPLLLLAGTSTDTGTVTIYEDLGLTEYIWKSTGFGDPGSGNYQQVAASTTGMGQFWIVIPGVGGVVYDESRSDLVSYTDTSGTLWVIDAAQDFELGVSVWEGVGGYAEGWFGGTLKNFMNSDLKDISGGFRVKILN